MTVWLGSKWKGVHAEQQTKTETNNWDGNVKKKPNEWLEIRETAVLGTVKSEELQ